VNCWIGLRQKGTIKLAHGFEGAINSYENCFMVLPQKIETLKKIGDCHLKLGNIEAANEAHRQFKRFFDMGN